MYSRYCSNSYVAGKFMGINASSAKNVTKVVLGVFFAFLNSRNPDVETELRNVLRRQV